MLPMTSVIVDCMFKNVFLTFYIRQAAWQGPSNVARPVITYPPTLPLDGTGCVNLRVN